MAPSRIRQSLSMDRLARLMPVFDWGRRYSGKNLSADLVAAVIVTIMLIPQSLAYALLAGLPPEMGLYASITPLAAYALFGTSRVLAVGPVAVISLMTAAAIGGLGLERPAEMAAAALTLALLSGLFLAAMGLLRLGFMANFLSHPVISGFITASGVIIAVGQLRHILGVEASGHNLLELIISLASRIGDTNLPTALVGISTLVLLIWTRRYLKAVLVRLSVAPGLAATIVRAGPVFAVIATILAAWGFGLDARGVAIVGHVPQGIFPLTVPAFDPELWRQLFVSALVISIVGFVESISVAQTLAARRRQHIDPDQELLGLGAANIAASFSGGYPVTGGFARSVVNADAGAETPAAGAFTAVGISLAALTLTPMLYFLPKATLAATIIVAVVSLIDFSILARTWRYSRPDFAAVATTLLVTLGFGIEPGIVSGIAVSIGLYLFRTSRPHSAVVGLVPGTQHFRNVLRHKVITSRTVTSLRVDESLYFANARFLEQLIYDLAADHQELEHFVLMCPAVNEIDASALESLEAINQRLDGLGVTFHLSEVKGPVSDRLERTGFLDHLTGRVFLSHYEAIAALDPDVLQAAEQVAPIHQVRQITDPAAGTA